MHLTFGTGIFWLLIASGVGETIIRVAKIRADKTPERTDDVLALQRRIAELERRLDEQTDVFEAQEQTIRRLEESGEFMQRLLRDRNVES
jgi:hypothetical protein